MQELLACTHFVARAFTVLASTHFVEETTDNIFKYYKGHPNVTFFLAKKTTAHI